MIKTRWFVLTRLPAGLVVGSLALGGAGLLACGPPSEVTPPPTPTATAAPVASVTAEPTATAEVVAAPECKEPSGERPAVISLLAGRPNQGWTGWAGDKSAAVEKACQKVAGRRKKLLDTVPEATLVDDVDRCLPSAKGAWVLDGNELRPLKKDKEHAESGWGVALSLAYVGADGKLTRSKKVLGMASVRGQERNDWRVLATFDYDGDGVAEIVVESMVDYDEESSSTRKMYTWKDGEAVEYAGVGFAFEEVLDVDGDKRPDLIVNGPFVAEGPCGLDGQTFRAPAHVAHSLANGTFSMNDAVAQEVVRKQCGPRESQLLVIERKAPAEGGVSMDESESVRRLTCARIYGAKAADVLAEVRKSYPFPHNADDSEVQSDSPACLPLAALVKLAAQEPTFTLAAPCPAK